MARMPIPPRLIVLDLAGILLAGVGLAGRLSDLSFLHPALSNRELAGLVAGAGFALMTFALLKIIEYLRVKRTQHNPGAQP
jgi:hypothetical protein